MPPRPDRTAATALALEAAWPTLSDTVRAVCSLSLSAALTGALALGCTSLALHVEPSNTGAVQLYRGMGFVDCVDPPILAAFTSDQGFRKEAGTHAN